jgi:hypothetical protein
MKGYLIAAVVTGAGSDPVVRCKSDIEAYADHDDPEGYSYIPEIAVSASAAEEPWSDEEAQERPPDSAAGA